MLKKRYAIAARKRLLADREDEPESGHEFRMYPAKKPFLLAASLGCLPPLIMLNVSVVAIIKQFNPANLREDLTLGAAVLDFIYNAISGEFIRVTLACITAPFFMFLAWKLIGPLFKDLMEWYYYDD